MEGSSSEAGGGEEEDVVVPVDPLSRFLVQRKKTDVNIDVPPPSPTRSQNSASQIGSSSNPISPSSLSSSHLSPAHFDVEGSLGNDVSARRLASTPAGSEHLSPTSSARLECALAPGSNVDFPTITEVCEQLNANPQDVAHCVEILVKALGERSLPRRRLKSLTILNELVYDKNVAEHFQKMPYVLAMLRRLQTARGTGLGPAADEQIRMFSTELERKVFPDAADLPAAEAAPAPPQQRIQQFAQRFSPKARSQERVVEADLWREMGKSVESGLSSAQAAAAPLLAAAVDTFQSAASSAVSTLLPEAERMEITGPSAKAERS